MSIEIFLMGKNQCKILLGIGSKYKNYLKQKQTTLTSLVFALIWYIFFEK